VQFEGQCHKDEWASTTSAFISKSGEIVWSEFTNDEFFKPATPVRVRFLK